MNGRLLGLSLLKKKMSKQEFARKLGISISTVYNMLANKRVDPQIAYNAAELLGVPFSDLAPEIARDFLSAEASASNR